MIIMTANVYIIDQMPSVIHLKMAFEMQSCLIHSLMCCTLKHEQTYTNKIIPNGKIQRVIT